jgi:hypothetical protein
MPLFLLLRVPILHSHCNKLFLIPLLLIQLLSASPISLALVIPSQSSNLIYGQYPQYYQPSNLTNSPNPNDSTHSLFLPNAFGASSIFIRSDKKVIGEYERLRENELICKNNLLNINGNSPPGRSISCL